MIRLKIDNIDIEIPEGASVLDAATKAGINIPAMCYLKGYDNNPSCMVCMVKNIKTGALIPSCAMKASNGMEISTSDPEVITARRQALELLLSDHIGDCEAPCSLACPAGMNIPLMNRLTGEGRFTEALNVVKEDIALPYILGYICPAPCEKACRRKQVDDAVSICLIKRFSASAGKDEIAEKTAERLFTPTRIPGGKTAIIGSGPAGLAAAYYLLIYGHSCDIFDRFPEPGGTLRYSIPEEDLPRKIIDNEVEIIKSMGAEFHFNKLITEEVFNTEIKDKYDAVILATGDISTGNHLIKLVELSKSGYQVNEKDMSSSVPGIFVCGSSIRPQKMAVRSVAQGKTAAIAAHHYINSEKFEKPSRIFNSRFDKLLPAEFSEYLKEASKSPRITPGTEAAMEGFSTDEAIREALRCMHCDCRKQDNCMLRIYANEYQVDRKHYIIGDRKAATRQIQHDLVVYEPEKCIKCGLCVEISNREGEKFGMAFEGRGFDVVITTPLDSMFSEGLSHTAVKCAVACPTGALSLKDKYDNFYKGSKP
jgi:ferredoxin